MTVPLAFLRAPSAARTALLVVGGLLVVLGGGWCYGDAKYKAGRENARTDVADSLRVVLTAEYRTFVDSAERRVERANHRADSAVARAILAESQAEVATRTALAAQAAAGRLSTTVVAALPPEVRVVLAGLQDANTKLLESNRELLASNRALVASVDSLKGANATLIRGLSLADTALRQSDTVVEMLRREKRPKCGRRCEIVIAVAGVALGAVAAEKLRR